MELQAFLLSILLLSIVAGSEARSVDQICSDKCKEGLRTFFVKDDYEYSYTYRTTIESSFHTESTHNQKSRLNIEVPFSIITSSDCNLVLKVKRGIYFDNRNPQTQDEVAWQEAITAYPLHFSWQNGIVDQICPSTDEPAWVSNLKRGILSSLQVSTTKSESAVRELDVSGNCEVDYFVDNSDTTIIRKTKDYTKCVNRDKHLLFSWSLPYELSSPRQNYIYSQQSCELVVADVLQSVNCNEEHVFRPFSTDEAGARTSLTQQIVFISQRRAFSGDYTRAAIRHTGLEYEDESKSTVASYEEKITAAKALLTEMCAILNEEAYQNVGKQFVSLVYAVRELNAESLTELNAHITTCPERRSALSQMLANTMPFCGTESCVTFASSLIMNNALEEQVAQRWLTGFSLIRAPTAGMISSVLDIVESRKLASQSFLTIGSMIRQFCQNSEENCMNNGVISSAVQVLTQQLGTNCRNPNLETRKLTLLALRAIGNAGQISSPATLRRCVEETQNSMEIRIAASAAYRRMSCKADRSAMLTALLDSDEDSELRISSYMNLMQCPTAELVKKVKKLLENEQNMQVGSYIWSHLTQTMESQDPLKHFFQLILQGQTFKEYSLDPRKYSRYYEASLFSEKLNVGGTTEASLIWSPKSFVPRSASVNVTLDLFGQAVNLLEFGGRIEGLENYLQSLLEPKAYEKRNARKDMLTFESQRKKNQATQAIADGAQASWFMRVFGNELMYGNTEMMESTASDASSMLSNILAQFMSDDGYNYHDDALLLNSMHTLPTGIGMPLHLAFNGSTSIDVNAAGKFNMGFGLSPEYLIKGVVTPRAAVVLTGSMIIDAHFKKTGIATESMAYTSTSLGGHVKLMDGGKSFEVELDSPYSKNMAFNFNHKLLKIVGNDVEEFGGKESYPSLNEDNTCTEAYIGQRLCYSMQYHTDRYSRSAANSLIFPVDGAVEMSAYVQKVDQGLTKYTVSGNKGTVYENEDDTIPSSLLVELAFDTPGSDVNRKATVFASYNIPSKQIALRAQRGADTLLMQGYYAASDGSNKFELSAELNENTYLFKVDVQKTFEETRKEVATNIEIALPDKTMSANGLVTYNVGERFQASFTMENVLASPVEMSLDLQDTTEIKDRLSFSGKGKLSVMPFVNSEFVMDMNLRPTQNNMIVNVNYKIGRSPKHSVIFHHKRTNLGQNGGTDWNVYHKLTSSQFTALNHELSVMHSYVKGFTKSSLDIGYGSRIDEAENPYKLEVRQEYSDTSDSSTTKVNGCWSMNFPYIKINRGLKFTYSSSQDQVTAGIDSVAANQPHHFTFLWKNNSPGSPLINQTTDIVLHPTPYGDLRLINELKEVSEKVYHSTTTLSLGETDELRFIQETVVTKKDDNKSIEFSLTKGEERSHIFMASSSNYVTADSKYISENQIDLAGYRQRGLDLSYKRSPTTGCMATVNFIKSSSVSVGIDATYLLKESGKHFSVGVRQYDIQQRTVLMKGGYDFIADQLFESYAALSEDDSILFSYFASVKHSNEETSGTFSLIAESHSSLPYSDVIKTNTSVSFSIRDSVTFAVSHLQHDKKLHFTMAAASNGAHVRLSHNYCDYMQEATYNIARTSGGVNVVISSGGKQAHATTRWSNNMAKIEWDHQDIPDLLKLNVPRRADLTLQKNSDYHVVLTVDNEIAFEITCSCAKQDGPTRRFSMTNKLLSVLPKTASWSFSINGEEITIKAGVNSEEMLITARYTWPEYASVAVSHNFELLQTMHIPTSFKIEYNSKMQPGALHLNLIMGEKRVELDVKYSQAFEISMTSRQIQFVPKKMLIGLEYQDADDRVQITGKAGWNDNEYSFNVASSIKSQPSQTFVPFVKFVGKGAFNVTLLMNEEKKLAATVTINVQTGKISGVYEIQQSVMEDYPATMKQEFSMSLQDNVFSLLWKLTLPASKAAQFHIQHNIRKAHSFVVVSMTSQGIHFLPRKILIDLEYLVTDGRVQITGKADWNEKAYSVNVKSSKNFRPSPTFVPFINFVGKADIAIGLLVNKEKKLSAIGKVNIQTDKISEAYEVQQWLMEDYPATLKEEHSISLKSDVFSLFSNSTRSSEVSHLHVEYTAGKMQLDQTIFTVFPEDISIEYNFGIEHGAVTANLKNHESGTASFSYRITDMGGIKLNASHTFDSIECFIPKTVTVVGQSLPDSEIQAHYTWGEENGTMRLWKNSFADMGASIETNGHIHFNFSYDLKDTGLELAFELTYNDHSFSVSLDGGCELSVTEAKRAYGDLEIRLDDKYASFKNSAELKPNDMLLNIMLKQNMLPWQQDFTFVRDISWNIETSSLSFQVDGTELDPFYFNVTVSHDEFDRATFEMHHTQKDWKLIPENLDVTLQKTVQDNNYVVTLLVSTEITASAKASLRYGLNQKNAFLEADFNNDFSPICKYWYCDIDRLSVHLRGGLTESGIEEDVIFIFNDKNFNETFRIGYPNFPSELSIIYRYSQNFLLSFSQNAIFSLKKSAGVVEVGVSYDNNKISMTTTYSESNLTVSIERGVDEEATLYNVGLEWANDPLKMKLTHDIDELSPIPKNAMLQLDMDESTLRISADSDKKAYEILLQKFTGDNVQKLILRHNLESLPKVPQNIVLLYKNSPETASVQWDDYQVSVKRQENGFALEQNVVRTFPAAISMAVNHDISSPKKTVHLDISVDDYSFQFDAVFGVTEAFSMKVLCIVTHNEDQQLYINATSKINEAGFMMIQFSQSLTDDMPNSLNYNFEYNLGKEAGYVAFDSDIEQLIKFKLTYSEVQSDQISFSLTHNVEAIGEMIPFESTGRLETEWTDDKKGFTATVSSSEGEKSFSFTLLTDMKSEEKVVTVTLTHSFEILETQLFIPKSASIYLHASEESCDASVTYTMDSQDNHVKFDMRKEISQVMFSFDQNIVKSPISTSNSRRRQVQVPQKVSLRLVNDDQGYQCRISFKAGQKRRYLNMKYSKSEGEEQTTLKITIDQNLNRMLQTKLPTESMFEVTKNSTTATLNLQWDENKCNIVVCIDTTEETKVGFSATQNLKALMEKSIPYELELRVKKNSEELSAFMSYDDYSGSILVQRPFDVEINLKSGALLIYSTSKATLINNELKFALTGTQTGLDNVLPRQFHMKVDASYDGDEMSAALSSTHNIESLPVPKLLAASIQLPKIAEYTMNSRLSVQADEIISENSIDLALTKKFTGFSVSINGVRTRNLWSNTQSDRLLYSGKLAADFVFAESKKSSLVYTFTESNTQGVTITNHGAYFDATQNGNEITWRISINLPPCIDEPLNISGSLVYGKLFKFSNIYSRGEYRVSVDTTGLLGENFEVKVVNKHGKLTIGFDKSSDNQFKFSHNMAPLNAFPRSFSASLNMESKITKVTADYENASFLARVLLDQIKVTYTLDGREIVAITGKYSTHPSQEIASAIKIIPLRVDAAFDLQMQFFRPDDGKSYIEFSAINNMNHRGLTSSAHAFLQDSNIMDINIGVFVNSNFTEYPIDAALEYSVDNDPLKYKLLVSMQSYDLNVSGSEESFSARVTMPEYFRVNDVLVTASCTGTDSHRESEVLLQINKHQELGFKSAFREDQNSHLREYEIRQPFGAPRKLSSSYRFERRDGRYILTTSVSDNERSFSAISEYTPSLEVDGVQHQLVVDITQQNLPILPNAFKTTGIVKYSPSLYDSNWRITTGGEDVITLVKRFELEPTGFQSHIRWKHPFEIALLEHFDGSLAMHIESNTLDVSSVIEHSAHLKHIPQRFKTTGKTIIDGNSYDSDWKITSGSKGNKLVVLRKFFKATDDGFNAHFMWKQPYADLGATSIESNVNLSTKSSSSKFLGSLKYNENQEWTVYYGWVAPNSYSKNFTIGFTCNDRRCESSFFYSAQPWQSTGKKFSMVYESNIPDNCFLSSYVPSQQLLSVTAYHKDLLTLFSTTYTSNRMENPFVVRGMCQISQGNALFNSSISIKNTPESSPLIDAEFGFAIDRIEGVTAKCSVPPFGIHYKINVMFDEQTSRLTLSCFQAESDPIVVAINLKDLIPRLQQILETLKLKEIWPKFKIIGDVRRGKDSFDAHIGVQIRDITYTLHLTAGHASETAYLNVTTKRNSALLNSLITISAHLLNSESAQIQVETSKELSRFLKFAFSSSAAEIKDRIVIVADALTEALNSLEGIVEGSNVIKKTIDAKRSMLIASVADAKSSSLAFITNTNSAVLASAENSEERMSSGLWGAIVSLSTAADKLNEIANRPLQQLKQDFLSTLSNQVYNTMQPSLQPLIRFLNNINAGQLLLELVQEGVTKFIFAMDKNAEAILNASKEPLAQLVHVSESKVVLNIPLHIKINGLIAPPSLLDIAMWIGESSLAREVQTKLSVLYKAVDLYYQYRSVLNMPLDELLPPFKGHSEIAGFRHIRTFDGQRYDYRSACGSKHVLVRDTRDNEFTVLVTYGSTPSITVETIDSLGGHETVVLKSDYTVTDERGRNIMVPTEYADVLVKRVGEIVTVQTTYGLVVTCNFVSELCTIDVSPFYFARLAGMMGTFNNEINDELVARGTISVSDFEELADAWKFPGAPCSASNAEQRCTEQTSNACNKLFEDRSSQLSACFAVENPAPYKQMCFKDTCSSGGVCTAFAAYARRCALQGVFLRSPPSCMSCDSVDGHEMRSTSDVSVSGADVVFVIEKSGCIRFRKKDYKKMIGEIHSSLNETVASGNVNYAVVGFGGPDNLANPHSVTFGNEIFLHSESYDLGNGKERALLSALKRGNKANAESDVLLALSYASQLPFRAGAARAIILLTCDDCSGESQVQTSYVRTLLQEQGVVLHHLRQKNIQAGKSSKKVYGFNTKDIFSKGTDSTLPRRALKISSSDQCLPLADMTGGSIWNSNAIGRESVRLLANEIANGVKSVKLQDCACEVSEYGTSTAKCTIAASRR